MPQEPVSEKNTVKISDEVLKGAYSNSMQVFHTKDEFTLDFINSLPPQAQVVARVITSPAQLKRILAALTQNLGRFEAQFGTISEDKPTPKVQQSSTSGDGFGF
ncbi:MAG TPA: DUF3467 domain-containing protein [Patescibacteria group bacterium]|jgi:ribosomal protein RSM22 (predicted rRNA methylase)|nr:DUF3467 domain-containing protein [Patescibacteria group bacterium]